MPRKLFKEEKCLGEETIQGNAVLDEKYFLTFGDLLTSFLVKNADSRWWIGKSPIGNRTTLVRGCGVDIPYARMKNWKEGEKKEDHNVWNYKDSIYTTVFFTIRLTKTQSLPSILCHLKWTILPRRSKNYYDRSCRPCVCQCFITKRHNSQVLKVKIWI